MGDRPRILVVDDEEVVLDVIRAIFEDEGWEVLTVMDGAECFGVVQNEMPDLVVLDIIMPKVDGFEVLRLLREWSSVPVIMLSVLGETADVVKCLNLGADDYISKPFVTDELLARIRAVLRRSETPGYIPAKFSFSNAIFKIDFTARQVTVKDNEVRLTPTEYSLLKELVLNDRKTLTYSHLLKEVWGSEYGQEKEYVHVVVNRLRAKLEPDLTISKQIITVPGVGYRFMSIR